MQWSGRFAAATLCLLVAAPAMAAVDWSQVDQAMGKKGAMLAHGVYKFGMPRSDMTVMLDGIKLQAGFALGTHVEFMPMGDTTMYMGDLVVAEDEIEPVMKALIDGGVEIAGIHNHLLRASPMVMYMHIAGVGDPVTVAKTIHAALLMSKTPFASAATTTPPALDIDTAAIDQAIGAKGTQNGAVYQFSIPATETITTNGAMLPPEMGLANVINFQPTGGGKAAITGDFTLQAAEVNPVIRAFRDNGIDVTALHSHVMGVEPVLFFVHYWANDDAVKLAKGLRAALDKANVKR